MAIETVGAIVRMAGLVIGGAAVVIGAEEAISDAIRPIKYQNLVDDVRAAVMTVAGETGKVNVIVIEEK